MAYCEDKNYELDEDWLSLAEMSSDRYLTLMFQKRKAELPIICLIEVSGVGTLQRLAENVYISVESGEFYEVENELCTQQLGWIELNPTFIEVIDNLDLCAEVYLSLLSSYAMIENPLLMAIINDEQSRVHKSVNGNSLDDMLGAFVGPDILDKVKSFGDRLEGIKGLHQNPEIIGTPTSKAVQEFALDYNEKSARLQPDIAVMALLSEAVNIIQDTSIRMTPEQSVELAKHMAPINPYINQSFLEKKGLNDQAAQSLLQVFGYFANMGIDCSEVALNKFSSRESDRKLELIHDNLQQDYLTYFQGGFTIIDRVDRTVGCADVSDFCKLSCLLDGLIKWSDKSKLSKADVMSLLLSKFESI
ncbi:MAG: hypothetical protein HAW67_08370 [Endozoicomonadaceae bacterium]|nr:hypothetical protein [Endozoicomonadaceae bacterium]